MFSAMKSSLSTIIITLLSVHVPIASDDRRENIYGIFEEIQVTQKEKISIQELYMIASNYGSGTSKAIPSGLSFRICWSLVFDCCESRTRLHIC
jgi:hypothetical protein